MDHVANYRPPKDSEDIDDITKKLREEGCAPRMPSSPESSDDALLPAKKQKKGKQLFYYAISIQSSARALRFS